MTSTISPSTMTTTTPAAAGAGLPAPAVGSLSRIIRDTDAIYEEMVDVPFDTYLQSLEDLVDIGLLTREDVNDDDRTYFRAREGLSWSDVVRFDCTVKKQILQCLIDNPRTFFVLYNTQKGKLRIAALEMRAWATLPDKKVVGFLLVDNDKTLADQTADGAGFVVDEHCVVFTLSSNTGHTFEGIKDRIDSYAVFGGKMPIIVALNNPTQIKKIIELMKHIKARMLGACPQLRYGVVFDEADKIYPVCRARFSDLLVEDERALHRLGFVTATEGDLLGADYPECANAFMYEVPEGDPNYRAIHTEDANVKVVAHRVKDSNDVYAEDILKNARDHFKNPIPLKNGSQGFRKTIVNGGAKTASMESFATRRTADGDYAITVNMNGVNVYRPGHGKKAYSAKGVRFSELLFRIYNDLGLHDKPLFIIGRRKVDRGLGFHFAPRDGTSNGLVWTDMILGRVDDKNTAVQKAGRLAGVVAQCPQFPAGGLTWWTDDRTSKTISRHNNIVDDSNTRRGCSVLQAVTRAEVAVPDRILENGPVLGSMPVILFDVTGEEMSRFNTANILNVIRKYNEAAYLSYKAYKLHCWRINTPAKCEKYGLNAMLKPSALSSATNIREEEKKKNVLMVYLHENKLILSPWNGEATAAAASQETLA
jgi:hypothetical protein